MARRDEMETTPQLLNEARQMVPPPQQPRIGQRPRGRGLERQEDRERPVHLLADGGEALQPRRPLKAPNSN
jgi:hypothetical protein